MSLGMKCNGFLVAVTCKTCLSHEQLLLEKQRKTERLIGITVVGSDNAFLM